ncbi:MAG: manganese-binding transcriptional regulator MntR [Chthonomonas sp.]|nr:manganese-binding transcriptional regulator MntR [Chthonomonas sp.]
MNRYERTRLDHSSEIAEDYVELIASLIVEKGEARVVDVASRLGVSQATVSKTLQRLSREGLLRSEPYRSIFLTDAGHDVARKSRERHELVVAFLIALGVSREAAQADAEGIEHHVSAETLARMADFCSMKGVEHGI